MMLEAAFSLAQAKVPQEIAEILTVHVSALSKPDGRVPGTATGCSLRRLVAKTLAKQFAEVRSVPVCIFDWSL